MTERLDARTGQDYIGNMAQVSVTLSADLQRHLAARAADGGHGNPAAYLTALAEQDRAMYRADVARVQALIDEGFASGIIERDALEVVDEIIAGTFRSYG